MPVKICENCKLENHVRRLACTGCGVNFPIKEKKIKKEKLSTSAPSTVGMGKWISDKVPGMPETTLPEPNDNELDNEELKEEIEYNGLGFCIYDFIQKNQIKDEELRKLWVIAKDAMKDIVIYLWDSEKNNIGIIKEV
jgi:hypothetical protein